MVVVLSNNDFRDVVSEIIERDYFPSSKQNGDRTETISLSHFHHTTTNESTAQLQKSLEEKGKAKLHTQSLIYASRNINPTATAELRNAFFFPVSIADVSEETPTCSSMSSAMMPPPQKRKPLPLSLNHDDDGFSRTTLNTSKTIDRTNVSSNTLINSSATRFPAKTVHYRRSNSRKRRNYYQDDNTEQHWEGSTRNGAEDDSYFTDLDATTLDSYSIRSELRKAKLASKTEGKRHMPTSSSSICSTFVDGNSIPRSSNSLVYQLPKESPREVAACVVIQQRSLGTKVSDRHRHRHRNASDTIHGVRSSHRSMKSLRSALQESYRKKSGGKSLSCEVK